MRVGLSHHLLHWHDSSTLLDNLDQPPAFELAHRAALLDAHQISGSREVLLIMHVETLRLFVRSFVDAVLFQPLDDYYPRFVCFIAHHASDFLLAAALHLLRRGGCGLLCHSLFSSALTLAGSASVFSNCVM